MPSEDNKKFGKTAFIIYVDLECLIEKIDGYKNNDGNSFTAKVSEHIPSDFSMSTILSFKSIENKHDICRSKDCMKRIFQSLGEHAIEIIDFKTKKNKVINKRAARIK